MERPALTPASSEPGLADALPAGTRLGEYEIERVIGVGGMGTVYAAWHPVLRSRAAVKVLNVDVSHNAAMVERFVSEAQAASRISHPYIIKVFGFGELADGRKYFVMEYLEGETMTAWLARGSPDPGEALALLLQVCEALEAAHREGIVHRDLKPDNLWIARPRHGRPYIKILDFGIAKAVEGPVGKSNTKTGAVLGTPQFMSPEQCTGRGVDHRTDIYAMGGILYCVYCGRPPFERESPAELVAAHLDATVPMPSVFADVPPALERLMLACLEKNPDKRPGSAAELAARLRSAAAPDAMAAECRPAPPATARLPVPTAVDGVASAPKTAEHEETAAPVSLEVGLGRTRRRWPLLAAGVVALGGMVAWQASRGGPEPAARGPAPLLPTGTRVPSEAPPPPAAAPPVPAPGPAVRASADVATGRSRQAVRQARPRPPRAVVPVTAPRTATVGTRLEPPPEPSRTTRAGLIEENPFR